jgi:hypothetical protein
VVERSDTTGTLPSLALHPERVKEILSPFQGEIDEVIFPVVSPAGAGSTTGYGAGKPMAC